MIKTTGNLLDFVYLKKNYKLIVIDLSQQTKSTANQFYWQAFKYTWSNENIKEKSEETTFSFLQNSATII